MDKHDELRVYEEIEEARRSLSTEQEKEWFTIADLRDWLCVGRSKAYEIIRPGPGSLPAYRIGKKILVRRQDVEDWLQSNKYYSEV